MALRDFDTVAVGDELPPLTVEVDRMTLVRYAGASGDFNVIHQSEAAATAVGLPNVIAHGMLTMAEAGRIVTRWAGDPAAVVEFGVRFSRPVVVPADTPAVLAVTAAVEKCEPETRTVTVLVTVRCGEDKVLQGARASVRLA